MYEYLPEKNLIINPTNPRKISERSLERLCASIREDKRFFDARPLLVNRIGNKLLVYGGCSRLLAARKLKMTHVPCRIDTIPIEVMNKRIIKDNLNYGEWDYETIEETLDKISLIEIGFDVSKLDTLPMTVDIPISSTIVDTSSLLNSRAPSRQSSSKVNTKKKRIFFDYDDDAKYLNVRVKIEAIKESKGLIKDVDLLDYLLMLHERCGD